MKRLQGDDRDFQFVALKLISAFAETGSCLTCLPWCDMLKCCVDEDRMSLLKTDVISAVLQALSLPNVAPDMTALCIRVIRCLSESGTTTVFYLCQSTTKPHRLLVRVCEQSNVMNSYCAMVQAVCSCCCVLTMPLRDRYAKTASRPSAI